MQLHGAVHVRRVTRVLFDVVDDLQRHVVRDVDLAAEERIGDVACAAQIEAERERIDVRQSGEEVVAIRAEANELSLDRFFEFERTGADRIEAEANGIAIQFVDRHDRSLMHRQQREEKRDRLGELDVDRHRIDDDESRARARAAADDVRRSANAAHDPFGLRFELGVEEAHERVANVGRFHLPAVVKTRAATQMETIDESLFEHFPTFGERGRELRTFAECDECRVQRLRQISGGG